MLSEASPPSVKTKTCDQRSKSTATFVRNAMASVGRLFLTAMISLALPVYLTRHLPPSVYGAWVLILQLSAYISFLDMGVQTAISKYVAECEAKGDHDGAGRYASAGLAIMLSAGFLGILLTVFLTSQVPHFFRGMPKYLYPDVRLGVLLIGVSLAFTLASSAFSGIFLGLQRYQVPMAIAVLNKFLYAIAITTAVYAKSRLAIVGVAVASVNLFTAGLQVLAWRRWAEFVRVKIRQIDKRTLRTMLRYCLVLAVWSAGQLCVNGLDLTIVGHYDYNQTAYYAIAITPTAMAIVLLSALLAPLLPAASALSTQRTPEQMGQILSRATRYSGLILYVTGLPFLIGGYLILKVWIGADYAAQSLRYLQVLVLANMIRNFCLPYSTMVVATGKQLPATAAAVFEGVINVASSIYLARHIGAIGVAVGTLLGACSSVVLHFLISMRYTRDALAISRKQLLINGFLRPSIMALPTALLIPLWWSRTPPPISLQLWCIWGVATVSFGWFIALKHEERGNLVHTLSARAVSLFARTV